MADTIMTVLGPIKPSDLGVTLMHEHILVNMMREHRLDGLLNDVPLAIDELRRFRDAGGCTIVDVTNQSLGRQPDALRMISEATGVHIVIGSGLYRHQYFEPWIDRLTTDELAATIVRDIVEGIDGTDTRSGIIGEIACDEWITAQEERSFRAAARAQKQTGLTLTTHAARWPVGIAQIDLLEEEGVDPGRIIIGHCDTVASVGWTQPRDAMDYHERIARRGAYVEFDLIRPEPPERGSRGLEARLDYVLNLFEKGHGNKVLLSQDICFRSALWAFGGPGYAYILTDFVPRLRERGLSEQAITMLLKDNPQHALTGI